MDGSRVEGNGVRDHRDRLPVRLWQRRGGGEWPRDEREVHLACKAGSYTARLAVTDRGQGMTGTASVTITVTGTGRGAGGATRTDAPGLEARGWPTDTSGSAPMPRPRPAHPERPLVAYKFYCGNGHHTTWLHRTSANCVYSHHGRYHVRVRVKDSLGAVDTVARTIRFRR